MGDQLSLRWERTDPGASIPLQSTWPARPVKVVGSQDLDVGRT